jgi:hypothetical protein
MSERKRTGGKWDPAAWPVYFIAANGDHVQLARGLHDHVLIAINELRTPEAAAIVEASIAEGSKVFIDSGVFALVSAHARLHGLTIPEAFAEPAEKIDGFDALFERYCEMVRRLGDDVWGYVELDFGGYPYKRDLRMRLEAMGLRPIPVYAPLVDPPDYLDELMQTYDRICVGGIARADMGVRKRVLATVWERRRRYPDVWVHMLGLTPSEWLAAYPMQSCDSSTYDRPNRFGYSNARIFNRWAYETTDAFCRSSDAARDASHAEKLTRQGIYEARMSVVTMQAIAAEQEAALGADVGWFEGRSTRAKAPAVEPPGPPAAGRKRRAR